MPSTTALLPWGPMADWCMTSYDPSRDPSYPNLCVNSTHGHGSDFITVCCDGQIINTEVDVFYGSTRQERERMRMEDMICCRQAGMNPGGLMPLPADYTHCASGDPTPLASMAATNTGNAQVFAVTYESALAGTADWTTRSEPSCLWVNTRNASSVTEVTLPAAVLTALLPESGEAYATSGAGGGYNATARSTSRSSRSSGSQAPSASVTRQNAASGLGVAKWFQAFLVVLLVAACQVG